MRITTAGTAFRRNCNKLNDASNARPINVVPITDVTLSFHIIRSNNSSFFTVFIICVVYFQCVNKTTLSSLVLVIPCENYTKHLFILILDYEKFQII